MANPFHNRIVGSIVIAALGVILLPDLLSGEKKRVEEEFATIPLRPVVAYNPQDDLPQVTLDVITPTASEANHKPLIEEQIAPAAPQALKQAGWTIRLGSFRDVTNVKRLLIELKEEGHRAYTLPTTPAPGGLTVVYVGPDLDRNRLIEVQSQLASEKGLHSQIVRYDPLNL